MCYSNNWQALTTPLAENNNNRLDPLQTRLQYIQHSNNSRMTSVRRGEKDAGAGQNDWVQDIPSLINIYLPIYTWYTPTSKGYIRWYQGPTYCMYVCSELYSYIAQWPSGWATTSEGGLREHLRVTFTSKYSTIHICMYVCVYWLYLQLPYQCIYISLAIEYST